MIYNWARGTGVEITWETAVELAKIDHVVAIKDSTANTAQALATLEKVGDRVRFFGGFISRLGLSTLRGLGGDGNIDGGGLGANFAVAFYEAFWRGDFAAAIQAADRYGADEATHPTGLERCVWLTAVADQGVHEHARPAGRHVRPPLLPIDSPHDLEAMHRILDQAGLFGDATPSRVSAYA